MTVIVWHKSANSDGPNGRVLTKLHSRIIITAPNYIFSSFKYISIKQTTWIKNLNLSKIYTVCLRLLFWYRFCSPDVGAGKQHQWLLPCALAWQPRLFRTCDVLKSMRLFLHRTTYESRPRGAF